MADKHAKLPTDWVKVVNISDKGTYIDETPHTVDGKIIASQVKPHKFEVLTFQENGVEHTIGKEPKNMKRAVAELGRKRTHVSAWGANRHRLEIHELPDNQRLAHPDEMPDVAKKLDEKDQEIADLKAQLAKRK